MKSIGFVDYYISEWHANNYPAWIEQACKENGLDYKVQYAWAQVDTSPVDGVTTDKWCESFGATRCTTLEELCEKSDVIVILCPSNPEKHLEFAKVVLPYGKPTYIDKPFADTIADAEEMFAIAKAHGTPFFSSSALRYATELDEVESPLAVSTLGGGSNLEEYIIHQAEMVVKKMGVGALAVKAQEIGSQYTFTVKYPDSRSAAMHFVKGGAPFAVTLSPSAEADSLYLPVASDFFYLLIQDILRFFETKTPGFDTAQTLEVNRILVGAIAAKKSPDSWVEL